MAVASAGRFYDRPYTLHVGLKNCLALIVMFLYYGYLYWGCTAGSQATAPPMKLYLGSAHNLHADLKTLKNFAD